MNTEYLKKIIELKIENAEAHIIDTTGTGDHFKAIVISDFFSGKNTLQRHKLIFELFPDELKSGELHALEIKTFTKEEYKKF